MALQVQSSSSDHKYLVKNRQIPETMTISWLLSERRFTNATG